jgi:hypothetical protein
MKWSRRRSCLSRLPRGRCNQESTTLDKVILLPGNEVYFDFQRLSRIPGSILPLLHGRYGCFEQYGISANGRYLADRPLRCNLDRQPYYASNVMPFQVFGILRFDPVQEFSPALGLLGSHRERHCTANRQQNQAKYRPEAAPQTDCRFTGNHKFWRPTTADF